MQVSLRLGAYAVVLVSMLAGGWGVGRITVLSTDQLEPELLVGPVASAKPLYDRLRDAVAAARKEARVVPLG